MKIGNAIVPRRAVRVVAVSLLAAGVAAGPGKTAHAQEWKPDGPVELIATNAPGGGSDRILRIFVKILGKYVPTPVTVVNKPGGGGAMAYHYAGQHPGSGNYLVLASRSILTNHIVGHGPSHATLTPVVHTFTEYISVNVKPVSPIQNAKQLVDFMKRDPGVISFGIATSVGGLNHQGAAVAFKAAGVDLRKMKNSAAFGASLVRNKQVRMLVVTSPKRLPGVLADVPTWKEVGLNGEVETYRYFTGPRGMTPAQIAFWERTIERATQAEEWKKELAENFWQHKIMGHAELVKFLDRDHVVQKEFLAGIGLAK
jgi:putative tricarboxylic transport membrane protein